MTSMPSSRKARAMILAPRSWPSRPGLATSTRIGCGMASILTFWFRSIFGTPLPRGRGSDQSRDRKGAVLRWCGIWRSWLEVGVLPIRAEDAAQGVADFSQGGVGADGIEEQGHSVFGSLGGALQSVEGFPHLGVIAARAEPSEFGLLSTAGGLIDLQQFDGLGIASWGALKPVDADYGALAAFDFALVAVAGVGDFGLREAGLDGGDHAAHVIDAADVIVSGGFGIEGQLFEEVAAAQWI